MFLDFGLETNCSQFLVKSHIRGACLCLTWNTDLTAQSVSFVSRYVYLLLIGLVLSDFIMKRVTFSMLNFVV